MYKTELCTLCDLNVNGDEYHYIMICPYFRQSRELYLKHYFYTRPNMLKFSQLSSSENKRNNNNIYLKSNTDVYKHTSLVDL